MESIGCDKGHKEHFLLFVFIVFGIMANRELAIVNNRKRNHAEYATISDGIVCWCKLLNYNEILAPKKLKFDSAHQVDIDDIKEFVKNKFSNKLQSIDVGELEVYAATDLDTMTPLNPYDVWDHKIHGGEFGTNPLIVKAPKPATLHEPTGKFAFCIVLSMNYD